MKTLKDKVCLKIYMHHNTMWLTNILREGAMNLIKTWWDIRENARVGDASAKMYLTKGTVAGAKGFDPNDDKNLFCDHWIMSWSEVVGMDIVEMDSSPAEEYYKSQKKLVDKALRDMDSGEGWKGDE